MTRCEQVRSRLDDYVAHALPAAAAAMVAEHLAVCAPCRQEHNALADLLAAARALPREIPPARDLWPDIAARLETAPRAVSSGPARFWRARPMRITGALLAAGLAVASVLWIAPRERGGGELQVAAVAALDASYRDVRASLVTVLDAHCSEMPPSTCAEVKDQVHLLDTTAAVLGDAMRRGGGASPDMMLLINGYEMTIGRARGLANQLSRI